MASNSEQVGDLIRRAYFNLKSGENSKVQIDNSLAKITCYKVGEIVRIDIKEKSA